VFYPPFLSRSKGVDPPEPVFHPTTTRAQPARLLPTTVARSLMTASPNTPDRRTWSGTTGSYHMIRGLSSPFLGAVDGLGFCHPLTDLGKCHPLVDGARCSGTKRRRHRSEIISPRYETRSRRANEGREPEGIGVGISPARQQDEQRDCSTGTMHAPGTIAQECLEGGGAGWAGRGDRKTPVGLPYCLTQA